MSSSKQRVFSTLESINYNDYLKKKTGQTLLQNLKKRDKNACINRFLNYQEFLNMSKSYYSEIIPKNTQIHWLTNMVESNQSFLYYQLMEDHVNSCNYCSQIKTTNSIYNIKCNQLLNILYPYGIYKDIKESNFYFPNKLNLKNWCPTQKKKDYTSIQENFIDKNIINDFSTKNVILSSTCGTKYNLCKNTQPLFI